MAGAITERTIELDGIEIFIREVAGSGVPSVYVHGNPTSSTDWMPFLERSAGPAIAFDLPGFGRSSRPDRFRFDHSLVAYANFVDELFAEILPNRFRLVVHDWGALALIPAQRRPDRVERLVIIDAVPFLSGYRWHWVARIWRRRRLGELSTATTSKRGMALALRQARSGHKPMPAEFVDDVWRHWDPGMRRAILALYRSADPHVLAAYGARLGELSCPALVVWGRDDPYIPVRFGRAYAQVLPAAELEEVERAGHWPWIDRPELVDRVVSFLESASP